MIGALLGLVGGLGLLLFGLKTVSEALQVLSAERLRRRVAAAGGSRGDQVAAGLITSLLTQSSAAAAVMIVSFVNAGLMGLPTAVGVLIGANLGAVTAVWLLALQLGQIGVGLLGVGAIAHLLAQREPLRFAGGLTMGIGMLFVGVRWMTQAWQVLGPDALPAWLLHPLAGASGAVLAAVLAAALAAALLQSATALLGVAIALAAAGLLHLDGAAALVIGANLGSCVTVARAAGPAVADGRRAALSHALLNGAAAVPLLLVFPAWLALLRLAPGGGNGTLATALHVALAHTTFNLLLAGLGLLLAAPLVALVTRAVGPAARERVGLRYLRQSVVEAPALAIEQCRLEVLSMAAITADALRLTRQLFADLHTPQSELRRSILDHEKATDVAQHELTVFLSRVLTGALSAAQSEECRALVRAADEIESVADYCERLANYRRRLVRDGVGLDAGSLADLQQYLDRTLAFFDEVADRIRRQETGWLEAIVSKGQYLAADANALRDTNLQRLTSQRLSPAAGIFFNDMLVAMRRIRNHTINLAEAYLGRK